MPYSFPDDVQALMGEQLASGKYNCEDEVLRAALQALAEEDEDFEAVQKALAGWRGGEQGISVVETFEMLRRKHGLGPFEE
jgi:putative addiction module CopG family antidote